jgi:hypothetical protein
VIDERGLSHLVAKDGFQAAKNTLAEAKGEPSNYDPLMSAHWMILDQAMQVFGLEIMGDYCPLCEVAKLEQGLDQEWITGCTDAILKYCQEAHMPGVPPIQ